MLALSLAAADLGAFGAGILDRHQLSHPQYNVLRMLRGAGDDGLTHGEITRLMVMGVPDVTRLVDRLEKRGLVRRERDSGDRRRVLHRIEKPGVAILEAVEPEMSAFHEWIDRTIPAEERRTLVELCEHVIEVAARESGRELASPSD